ncbi:MAG TPA: hypothetical protein VFJ94_14530 [Intrasporangium sp.]|uniref:hypothetical protein n=1 Tax=Intrasporangium sp. TaxID=1925024 RepID=UPI002D789AB1|nr:hypothetical protein [Intrasporangium sp.]HET7399730.1 hypothetical protein [Intrasporangium sp.]
MPLHGYTTDRRPPSLMDHVFAHPFELTLATWCGLAGAMLAASTITGVQVSPTLDRLPWWLSVMVGALLVVGGICQVWGLFDDSDDIAVGWKIERVGLILSGSAWSSYTLAIVYLIPGAVLSWSLGLAILTMLGLRFTATVKEEQRIRKAIRQ